MAMSASVLTLSLGLQNTFSMHMKESFWDFGEHSCAYLFKMLYQNLLLTNRCARGWVEVLAHLRVGLHLRERHCALGILVVGLK